MEEGFYIDFLNVWHPAMRVAIIGFVLGWLGLYAYHHIRLLTLKEYKAKYDHISKYQANLFFYSILSLALGVMSYLNTLRPETVALAPMWFFVRLFVTICIGTLIAYIAWLVLNYSYPTKIQRRLQYFRYKTRINPKTGNRMRLLSEEEEDVHLDEGMQAEENVFSVDYDVWIDEVTNDIKIEKYPGYLEASQCDRCNFQTLRLEKEEITKTATEDQDGELIKHYKCSYCNRIRRETKTIARLGASGKLYKLPEKLHYKDEIDKKVKTVEIKIFSNDGKSRSFDFPSTLQAQQFLAEYESETVE